VPDSSCTTVTLCCSVAAFELTQTPEISIAKQRITDIMRESVFFISLPPNMFLNIVYYLAASVNI
jgi:hypothetical protein